MAYLVDGVVLVSFLIFVLIGCKQGFIKAITGLAAFAVAAAAGMLLSGPASEWAYDNMVEPTVIKRMDVQMSNDTSLEAGADRALTALPRYITNALANSGITSGSELLAKVDGGAENLTNTLAEKVVRPVVVPLLKLIITLVVFIIVYILARILLGVLDLVAKLPLLKQVNKTLGLVAGVLTGVLWVLFITGFVQMVAAVSAPDSVLSSAMLSETILTKWLIGINPIGSMLQEVMVLVD